MGSGGRHHKEPGSGILQTTLCTSPKNYLRLQLLQMNNRNFLQIAAAFTNKLAAYNAARKSMDDKIDRKQKQLDRLIARRKKMKDYPRWTEQFLRPVIDEIKPLFPDWICDDERLTPMGLGSRVSLFFTSKSDSEKYIYLVFVPGDLQEAELSYETGESRNRFAKNTIGEINGFNRVTKLVESIEELVAFLKQQIVTG
jgi:hypothetical protein